MINGVIIKNLKVIPDERGRLMEILRNNDECFEKFGQVYMTTNYPGVVKAWHFHKIQTDNVACIHGMIKVVLYDGRENSPTKGEINEFFIGEQNPRLITIPRGVFHGWKNVCEHETITINIPTEAYCYIKPDEYRCDFNDPKIPYNWDIKNY